MTNLVCFIDKVVISIQSMLVFAFVTEDRNTSNSMVAHRTRRFPFYLLRKFFELLKSTSAFFLLIRNPLDSRLFKTSWFNQVMYSVTKLPKMMNNKKLWRILPGDQHYEQRILHCIYYLSRLYLLLIDLNRWPEYIARSSLKSNLSMPCFCIAHQKVFLGTLSKAFSRSIKVKYKSLFFLQGSFRVSDLL